MGTFVAFQHERGEQVLINSDHVVMVVGDVDVCTLILSNNESIPVRGTLHDVHRLLRGSELRWADGPDAVT